MKKHKIALLLFHRCFWAKLIVVHEFIKKNKFFGELATLINAVEFQKRDLPHAHFLIILKDKCKLKDPAQFDQFIKAVPPKNNVYLV